MNTVINTITERHFADIYCSHYNAFCAYARAGLINKDDAEDVVSVASAKFCRRYLDKPRDDGHHPIALMYEILRCTIVDFNRKERRLVSLDDLTESQLANAVYGLGLDDQLERTEQRQLLRNAKRAVLRTADDRLLLACWLTKQQGFSKLYRKLGGVLRGDNVRKKAQRLRQAVVSHVEIATNGEVKAKDSSFRSPKKSSVKQASEKAGDNKRDSSIKRTPSAPLIN